jgi:hypothetical protein
VVLTGLVGGDAFGIGIRIVVGRGNQLPQVRGASECSAAHVASGSGIGHSRTSL